MNYKTRLRYLGGGDARLGSANGAGQDGSGLVVSGQDLGDAAVRHAELARYVARPDAELGQLDDAQPHRVGQRAPVHEHAAELVHLAVLRYLTVAYLKRFTISHVAT